MNVKLWIATYVDHNETCDGKARVLDVCMSKNEAEALVRSDIEKWADDHAGENIEVDFCKKSAAFRDSDDRCEWNIEETCISVNEDDEQTAAIDDGQIEFNFN